MIIVFFLIAVLALGLVLLGSTVRVIRQFERGVILRFGRVRAGTRGPGLAMIVPFADRLHKVNMQIVTMPVPAQEGITRDNVTVKVDAVVYYRVVEPVKVVVDVQNYTHAIGQVAQASLRSIIGKSDLDDLLSNRERLNQGMELMIDSPALDWGVHIDRVEIKDVALPESMKRSMSRQAEAERERRSRVITAEGELQASAEAGRSRRGDGRAPGRAAAAAAADRRRGRRGEELDPGAALPRGAAALPRAVDTSRGCRSGPVRVGDDEGEVRVEREGVERPTSRGSDQHPGTGPGGARDRRPMNRARGKVLSSSASGTTAPLTTRWSGQQQRRHREVVRCGWCTPSARCCPPIRTGSFRCSMPSSRRLAAAEVLCRAVARARSVASDLAMSTWKTQGPAARALIDEARGAAMLVVGSHGRTGLRGLLAGSVRSHVAAHTSCPVVVVRPTDGARVRTSAAGDRARVVVGIDRTSACAPAIGFAFRAAAQRGIPLAAVHAWTPDTPADLEGHRGRPTMAEAMARRAVEKELARWREEYAGVPVLTTLLCGDPVQALVSVSRGAALVVVGSRGRGHLRGTVLGSVSQTVMQHVRCPIAIVRGRRSATERPADVRHRLAS